MHMQSPKAEEPSTVLGRWRRFLGHDIAMTCEEAGRATVTDVGAHRPRDVLAVLRPSDLETVRRTVIHAAEQALPLYPISTGRNWGMGSWYPVEDGCTLLDLGRLNRIRRLDLERGYAVIEPGVTQRQLAAAIQGSAWQLNVTTSCADTSLIGNALDRGDGVIRPRLQDLLGVEAVLADGEVFATGGLDRAGRYLGPASGPNLTQTLVQSNLAVVTAAAFALVPRPERTFLFQARFRRGAIADVLEALTTVARTSLPTRGTPRILRYAMTPASGPYLLPGPIDPETFSVMVPMLGTADSVALSERMMRTGLANIDTQAEIRCIDAEAISTDDPLFSATKMIRGTPNCEFVQGRLGSNCSCIDTGPICWMVLMPLLPLDAGRLRAALHVLQEAIDAHPTGVLFECSFPTEHTAYMVAQIAFDRSPDAGSRAHLLRATARQRLIEIDCVPYRSNIDFVADELRDRNDPGQMVLDRLKDMLDPAGILAPGRYLRGKRWR